MSPSEVTVGVKWWDDSEIRIEALWNDRVVGFAAGSMVGSNLRLCDLVVEDALRFPRLGGWFPPIRKDFQGQGIGSRLLTCLIAEAKNRELASIFGFVVERDRKRCPWLLDWYHSRGFSIIEANPENPHDDQWFPSDPKIILDISAP